MNKALLILYFLLGVFWNIYAQVNPNHVLVNGYTRSDGTVVKPYYRTAPNSTNIDNFSTRGNTNPYTGEAGWIPRDDNYAYSYISSNRSKNLRNYRKTEPIHSYGRQKEWISQKLNKLAKISLKKNKKYNKDIRKTTKKNKKYINNKKELDIKNFSDGWYYAIVRTSVKINNEYEEVLFKREVLLQDGKVVKYIGFSHLVYDIYNFDKVTSYYKFKLIYPDNSMTDYGIMSFYENEPLKYTPYYEYPNVVFFYVTESNNGGKISMILESDNIVYNGGSITNYWNEIPRLSNNRKCH
ncbi:hypothetical protein N7U66_04820 [Lacinutrix neustonica]|uniref:Uncharacterized protein n=1 Tax=Lacinutrix neustonica TaxID=2980107 RepID=A0A9E8MZ75_9FLAO|nr:hypothetical protein [Lacinutrix neustonica]WAC02955.1 hypothetical protein N7U66_04820 [Lacinutrix neustonica]